jgi:hypothetical protein
MNTVSYKPTVVLVLGFLSSCSATPPPAITPAASAFEPGEYSPPPPPARPSEFDACTDDIENYKSFVDEMLSNPGDTPWETERTAANLWDAAGRYREVYWTNGETLSGLSALRLYDGYLRLVPPSDQLAPVALLHSIAIYCGLDCHGKAKSLVRELERSARARPADIAQALSYCKG